MRSSITAASIARAVGCVFGLGLAFTVLLVARPSASAARMTATVRFAVPLSGELAVTPRAPEHCLIAAGLRPGGAPATGRFEAQNQTGETIAVGFRARRSSSALDGLVRVRLSVGGRSLADTTLQGLGRASDTVLIGPGSSRKIKVEAWMPQNVGDGYEGRDIEVSLVPAIAVSRG